MTLHDMARLVTALEVSWRSLHHSLLGSASFSLPDMLPSCSLLPAPARHIARSYLPPPA